MQLGSWTLQRRLYNTCFFPVPQIVPLMLKTASNLCILPLLTPSILGLRLLKRANTYSASDRSSYKTKVYDCGIKRMKDSFSKWVKFSDYDHNHEKSYEIILTHFKYLSIYKIRFARASRWPLLQLG